MRFWIGLRLSLLSHVPQLCTKLCCYVIVRFCGLKKDLILKLFLIGMAAFMTQNRQKIQFEKDFQTGVTRRCDCAIFMFK